MKCVLLACLLAILVVASADAAKLPATKLPRGWKKVNAKAGELNPNQQFHMTLALRRNNLEKLDKIFWEVSDPQNPKYGNHLNHEEMRSLVSPGPAALSTVTSWLKSNGVNNFMVARHEDSISFDASMSQIQQLLKVKFAMYESKIDKRRVAKALGVMVVPDAVAEVVEVIAGHRGFPLPKGSSRPKINKNLRSEETNVTPRKLYESYNMSWFPKTPAGKRNIQSFFQAQGQAVSASDLSTFCQTFLPEITNCTISKYIGDNEGGEPGVESSLDSEFIFATGRGTETWVYSYNNMDFCGDLIRWGAAVLAEETFPYVISMSYGAQALPNYCLGPDVDRLSRDVQKMGTMGITVIIASGDNGSGEDSRMGYNYGLLGASMPASIPYCISVGSTTFITGNSGQQQATADFGSGGGFSFDYAMPPHQEAAVSAFFATNFSLPPPLSYNASGRGTPDVSVLGDNFFIISGGAWEGVSGTSCSTPSFAGMVTLLNNIRLEAGKTLGFLGPLIYQNPNAFTDIVVGNNDVNSDGYGWYTVAGWDPATGLGTPNFGNLAEVVKSLNARDFSNPKGNRIPVN